MKQLKTFRKVNTFEKSIIVDTLNRAMQDSELIIKKIQDRLYISFDSAFIKNFNPSIYLIPSDKIDLIERFNAGLQISSAGLYFGFITKENFRLSLEGAEYLLKREDGFKEKILVVNSKGEKSILYGNDIYKEEIVKIPKKLNMDDLIIIYNSAEEVCAITQSLVDFKTFSNLKPRSKIALNLVDKGYYLRKKQ